MATRKETKQTGIIPYNFALRTDFISIRTKSNFAHRSRGIGTIFLKKVHRVPSERNRNSTWNDRALHGCGFSRSKR